MTDLIDVTPRHIDVRPGKFEINGVSIRAVANEITSGTSFLDAADRHQLKHAEVIYACWLAARLFKASGLQDWASGLDHLFAQPPSNLQALLNVVSHPKDMANSATDQLTLETA